ncbi:hypothetical protein BpHYR1_013072 [Brachionus plicatilis]|uniref:Uncharacterized protein n=1 Tax=Brachionus plicatilis TaxID=10195 RepID=A0A3M7RTW4_BRAPC|nr:hypothetical protein BpHYR1_013072 [Brachionus plicatilis]
MSDLVFGLSIYLDSKPLLFSSTSLTVNGTEWLSPVLTYLSLFDNIIYLFVCLYRAKDPSE